MKTVPIGDFNMGGLADSKFSGIKNSMHKLLGWDLHSVPGIAKVAQKLTKISGATVTELPKVKVECSDGNIYWFSSTSGKIWKQASDDTFTLVHTTVPNNGAAACLGAYEWDGFIYWATQTRLHRIPTTGLGDWAANAVQNWQSLAGDTEFHPMIDQNLVLFIGDGTNVAQVDAGVFTAVALDLPAGYRVKSLGAIGTDLLIGTTGKTRIFRWNTTSVSFTVSDDIPETGINAFLPGDNVVYVSAGQSGNIYYYNGEKLELYRMIPGEYSPTKTVTVNPNAVGRLGNSIFFGLSQVAGIVNGADLGVYQLGRHDMKYPYIIDLPYPISKRTGDNSDEFVLSGLVIGAIAVSGSNVYVSWQHGADIGIDKVDYTTKLDGAYMDTRVMRVDRFTNSTFPMIQVAYASLPENTSIEIATSKNYAAYVDQTVVNDEIKKIVYTEANEEATAYQMRVTARTSANTAPEIEMIGMGVN